MSGAIPPLPNTPSWRGAQLKKKSTGTNLPLPFRGTGGPFLGVRPRREADLSPPYGAEVKNVYSYTSNPPYSTASCLIKQRISLHGLDKTA
jgi:hypothetical protein